MKQALLSAAISVCASQAMAYHHSCHIPDAMTGVIGAMRSDKPSELAANLPQSGAVVLTSTIDTPPLSSFFDAQDLAQDLLQRGEAYRFLIKDEEFDSFGDVFSATDFRPWRVLMGQTVVPPGVQYYDGRTFIRFVCTSDGPRIAEIGWPAS